MAYVGVGSLAKSRNVWLRFGLTLKADMQPRKQRVG
jgi:hypothetical protein